MTPNVNVIFFKHFRWVEDQKVSERIVEIWPSIIKILNHWMSLPSYKQPKCKSYEVVKGAVKDPFTVAKLKFFGFIAGRLVPYLTIYQPQKPLIPFLYDDFQSLYRELLGFSIKSEVLQKCKDDCKELLKIDLRDVKNHMKKKGMCWFWHVTRALVYPQKGACNSCRCKQISNGCNGISNHIIGKNVS